MLGIEDRKLTEIGAFLQGTFSLVGEKISPKCFKCNVQGVHTRLPGGSAAVSGS